MSRIALSGKFDQKVGTHLTFDMVVDLDRRAHEFGVSRADLLREIIAIGLYGRDAVLTMHAARLDRLTASGPDGGQK